MLIGKSWKIESDELNVCLYKRTRSKKGKESWACKGYYNDANAALCALVDTAINGSGMKDLQSITQQITEIKHDIETALKEEVRK